MRITRSGLRRIIAEESARILAETKKRDPRHFSRGSGEPHRDGDGDDVQDAIDILNDTGDDYYGDDDPFGDDAALAQGLVDDGVGGWRQKTDDEWAAEQEQGVMDMYGHPDPYGDDEALEKGYEYDGAGGWKKPGLKEGEGKGHHVSPRKKLGRFLAKHDVDDEAVFKVINAVVSRAEKTGAEVTSEDITFNLPDEIIDALPEDEADAWHSMLEDVLADEIDPDAFADAERDRQDVEDTERDLSHPSNFIELEEGEGDADGPDQYDPDDPEGHADAASEYQRHSRFWSGEGGSSLKASHSDFDDVRGSAGPVKRFITRGRQGKPHRVSDDGLDIDSGDESLFESRWSKLAGILSEGVDDDLGGAASATDSGDREGRRGEHFGDDPDWGPPGHDDWHIDNYEDEDIEGSDFDEMIDPADDNDDPMKPAWMNSAPYADTAEDDWTLADDPYVGGRAASAAIRQKYSETGNSDPEDDRSPPRGHRYGVSGGWGGLDEAEVSETYISHWDRDEEADREEDERIRRSLEPSPLSTVHTYPSDRKTSDHPSGLTGMGGPYSEYDHLHYGAGINEARWAKLAGILKG